MKVEIKERQQKSGNSTLYLEYYEKGFRKRENLHLTVYPDTVRGARKLNKDTYAKAQAIRSDRILNPPSFVVNREEPEENVSGGRIKTWTWLQWAVEYARFGEQEGNAEGRVCYKKMAGKRIREYLALIRNEDILLKDVTSRHISGLYDHMRNRCRNGQLVRNNEGRLSGFSLMLFGQTVSAMFNRAVREELIPSNPVHGLESRERFPVPDTRREYLTADELKRFLAVETATEQEGIVQKAFGFSCMTGLRSSDMHLLRWSSIRPMGKGLCVHLLQKKTRQWVTVPLNGMALSLLPPRPEDGSDGFIFRLARGSKMLNMYVRRIAVKAGIRGKKITYHCSRHTAATLAVSAGADLSTVSKILGHKSTVCTQVYAKVSLEKKIEAVNLTDGLFD